MPNNTANAASVLAAYTAAIGHLMFFVGGTLITLLVSIFDVTRRTALKLFAGCIFGGLGALVAGLLTASWGMGWSLFAAGIGAVMAENVVLGFVKASKEFSENPFATITQVIKDILPSLPFGKKSD